jgi:hypothetical protein
MRVWTHTRAAARRRDVGGRAAAEGVLVETNGHALVEAMRGIGGRVHVCLEEGTQGAWLYEPTAAEALIRGAAAAEIGVAVAP